MVSPSDILKTANREHVVLMPRDPFVAYVYWEVDQASLAAGGQLTGRLLMLPRGESTAFEREVFEFPVESTCEGYFVEFIGEDIRHVAEIGYRTEQGGFDCLVRSEIVRSPRSFPGTDPAHFVAVQLTKDGLLVDDTDHRAPDGVLFSARQSEPAVSSLSRPRRKR